MLSVRAILSFIVFFGLYLCDIRWKEVGKPIAVVFKSHLSIPLDTRTLPPSVEAENIDF